MGVPTASAGYPRCLQHGSVALCFTFTPGLNPIQDFLATITKAADHLVPIRPDVSDMVA